MASRKTTKSSKSSKSKATKSAARASRGSARKRGGQVREASDSSEAPASTPHSAVRRRPSRMRTAKTAAPMIVRLQLPSDEDIARRAYQLWEMRGRLDGYHQQDWLQAERELMRTAG